MAAGRRSVPTVADVAARPGVSVGTVSKAMNGRGQLRDATRERVLAAAKELGFQPNALARGLLEGRTYTVGVLTTDSFGRFTIPIMLGVEDALGAGEMTTLLCDGRDDPLREQHYVRTLLGRRVDGIVVTGRRRDPRPPIGDLPIPVVYVFAVSESPDDLSITYDDEQGGALAVATCSRTGRTRIAHVTGPAPPPLGPAARGGRPGGARARRDGVRRRRARCGASGARRGAATRRTSCCAPATRSTPCSAAATRSPAASPTRCARRAGACPRTSRSSASTTGT